MQKNPSISSTDAYFERINQWHEESAMLRATLLECGLQEELKWGKPCYSYEGNNITIIQGFKAYLALLFFKGMLMKDPDKILVKTGINTRVGRQIRFENIEEIVRRTPILKGYILQAIELEKKGLKVPPKEKTELVLPEALIRKMKKNGDLKKAFSSLTPGRQRAYVFYFSQPKLEKTRDERIEKCIPKILTGKGLMDR